MESFVLLILSLMTGCEASSKVKGCRHGWVDFTLKYPDTKEDYQTINIANPRKFDLQSNETNVWRTNTSLNVYHDKMKKSVRVIIKQLEKEDEGDYRFGFKPKNETITVTLEDVKVGCQKQFNQTAYETAKTTITCDYPNNYSSFVKFICKDSKIICEEILSKQSSNGTFTLTNTSSGFNMSISNVSSQHAGDYWCGVKSKEGSNRASLRKIKMEIETITTFERKLTIGQDFKYWCDYKKYPLNKFICKGEDPSICQPLLNTTQPNTNTGKFSMQDDKKKKITITVRNVTTNDTGTYWCGAETSTRSKLFYHKFLMTVVTPQPESGSHDEKSHDEKSHGDSWVVIMIICIAVLLLLLLLNVILIYKRFSCLKNTINGAPAQQITQHNDYEEIPERPKMPDSGNAVETIYAMANLPTNPSASLHYSTITFKSSTDKANGEALIPKPSSSTCEYSAVSQSPIYSVIYKPSKTSEHPL